VTDAWTSDTEAVVARVAVGHRRTLSRLLTRVEAQDEAVAVVLDRLYCLAGKAHVVGITGVPGAGKSTLVARLALELRKTHTSVAVVAVDPSSTLSGGAILGDRIRMHDLILEPTIYVRSMASRGALGGLARATPDVIDVLDAAGFGVILVETVGVGQDEFEIADLVDTTVVVSAPGLGDDVQAIKAGIMEMADIHVVNKSDKPEAHRTRRDIEATLAIAGSRRRLCVPVLASSAETGQGIDALAVALGEHLRELDASGQRVCRWAIRSRLRVLRAMEELIARRMRRNLSDEAERVIGEVIDRKLSPRAVALRLLGDIDF
jgi:LAO/AO transport system kinase